MLVLTRRRGDEIVIGDNIRLTVIAIRGNKVRLGVTAPQGVSIQRDGLGQKTEDVGAFPGRPEAGKAES
jgi:carbon storage regulator